MIVYCDNETCSYCDDGICRNDYIEISELGSCLSDEYIDENEVTRGGITWNS